MVPDRHDPRLPEEASHLRRAPLLGTLLREARARSGNDVRVVMDEPVALGPLGHASEAKDRLGWEPARAPGL